MKRIAPIGLEMRDVAYAYPGQSGWAINHINLKFDGGHKVAVVGRNGSGKSTLLMVAAGLLRPTHGQIFINGQPVTFDLQGTLALRRLVATVLVGCDDQIMDAHSNMRGVTLDLWDSTAAHTRLRDATLGQRVEQVNELRRMINAMLRPRHALSLGEQAIAAMQSALRLEAAILILDHAFDVLDRFERNELLHQLDAFANCGGLVLLSTHDIAAVCDWASMLLVMAGHEVAMMAPPNCILADSFLRRVVFGKDPSERWELH